MPNQAPAQLEAPDKKQAQPNNLNQRNVNLIIIAVVAVVVLVVGAIIAGLLISPSFTATVRDVMIIFMALILLLIGGVLVWLTYEIAMLIIVLRDEIKPLIESANETLNVLRGTTVFMSDNIVEPTIKASSTLAGARRVLEVLFEMRPGNKRKS